MFILLIKKKNINYNNSNTNNEIKYDSIKNLIAKSYNFFSRFNSMKCPLCLRSSQLCFYRLKYFKVLRNAIIAVIFSVLYASSTSVVILSSISSCVVPSRQFISFFPCSCQRHTFHVHPSICQHKTAILKT